MSRHPNATAARALAMVAGVVLLSLVGLILFNLLFVQGVGRPVVWELPAGYQGWVVVRYLDATCPPLPVRGIFLVVSVPPSGRVCMASTGLLDVWRGHSYVYLHPDGTRTPIPGTPSPGEVGIRDKTADHDAQEERFFVGTEVQLRGGGGPGG